MKVIHTSGKRKRAVARATLRPGTGLIKVNNILLQTLSPRLSRERIEEPIMLADGALNKVDVSIRVFGGGNSSQADASRLALARGILEWTGDKKLEQTFLRYDRQLLVADVRRKEPAKPNSHGKARAKRQKSYR